MLVGVVFLSVAYVQSVRGHIKIELLDKALSTKGKAILDVAGDVIGLFIMSLMAWQAGLVAWRAWVEQEYIAGVVPVPSWPAKIAFALGIALLCVRLLLDISRSVTARGEERNEP